MNRFAILLLLCFTSFLFASELKVKTVDQKNDVPAFAGYNQTNLVVKFSKETVNKIVASAAHKKGVTGLPQLDALNKLVGVSELLQKYPNKKPKFYQDRVIDLSLWFKVTVNSKLDIEEVAKRYKALPGVIDAQPSGIHKVYGTPNDPNLADQWHLDQANDHDMDAPEAWDIETGNSQIIVACMDTGVRYFHKDLGGANASIDNPENSAGNMWINEAEKNGVAGVDDDNNGYVDDWIGWDFVDNQTGFSGEDADTPDNDPRDFNGHGTHITGTIGAINNNGYAVSSVAGGWGNGSQQVNGNGVKLMALRIGYSGRLFIFEVGYVDMGHIADAFIYAADNGARIASCSWGSSNSGGLGDALDYFIASGGLVFKAAGNDDDEGSDYMLDRADVIGVASTDQNDVKSDFSTYGTFVDISAPGTDIYATYHDHDDPNNDYVASLSGTSMATPNTAGTAALIWSQNPSWTAEQVKQRLFDTADDIYGIAGNSAYAGKLGAGRINAFNAVNTGTPTAPTAAFSASPTSGCPTLTVNFTDNSSGTIDTWSWDFGDGGSSSAQSPSHDYTSAGTYTVSLTVTGPGGSDTHTETNYITVTDPTVSADFSGTPLSGDSPLNVAFTDASTGNVTGWNWDFGDGGSSTSQNPNHTYNAAGTYTVTLTASNACASDGATKTDYITVTDPPCDLPVADFSGTPLSGDSPLNVAFTDNTTNNPTSWSWDFGDGGSSTSQNPSHTYNSAGTYTVALTSTNSCGTDTETKVDYITVTDPPCDLPVAEFSGTPVSGDTPLNVSFTDNTTNNPTSFSWDFGDGGSSTAQNPNHTYNSAGSYTVALTATNACGNDTETKVNYITVSDPPAGDEMHVESINVSKQTFFVFSRAHATVKIVDQNGDPVSNASIDGSWGGSVTQSVSLTTNSNGEASSSSRWIFGNGTFEFCVDDVSKTGYTYDSDANVVTCASTDGSTSAAVQVSNIRLEDIEGEVGFKVAKNSPNPFNPSTTITFLIPEQAHVKLEIYNVLGQRVRTLINQQLEGGVQTSVWDGKDISGNSVSSGFYVYQITVDNKHKLRKKILMLK
ncbi:MAG: PKD domain-containing protein [Calditrichaeota bacterium]|nr:MAG: PKD domain-containing protein [Calditrichota bacterium]MBL1206285.1 PKD domain-containing protein [Calditrichota bacterium]NOG46111.1 PKD domain-containing protein [Calditrichota bacterium]